MSEPAEEDIAARLARVQADEDLRWIMGDARGRRFINRLLEERCAVLSLSFFGEQSHQTAFLEGKRSVGVELHEELHRVASAAFVQMLSEAHASKVAERLASDKREREQKENADG